MSSLFIQRGFFGAAHDLGPDSRRMMRENPALANSNFKVVEDLAELAPESFDYLFAFEVLEHIEDDGIALRNWMRCLKPGGRLLVSVPAHQRKYGRSDLIVGHVRRYEKPELAGLLKSAGADEIRIVNYGFPLTEASRRISNWLIRNDSSYDSMTAEERSIRSAQAKPKAISKALIPMSGKIVAPFCAVQRWFYRLDWVDGYVASGIKRAGSQDLPPPP